jgi:16S rRNA (adenine1518-N6/adenine1519-N6)-dimethyltransferase
MSLKEKLMVRLDSLGVEAKRSLGQNFLIRESVVTSILAAVEKQNPEFIIEVGPGLGALTDGLQALCSKRALIELDRKFSSFWREQGENVIEDDALQVNWAQFENMGRTVLVSNLPYQIAGRLVVERSLGPLNIVTMVLMFQKEVAERIAASPRSKAYGFLSVVTQTYWKVTKVCDAGPQDFYPPPKIASRVLKFERAPESGAFDQRFVDFVKNAFVSRRKTMIKNFKDVEKPFLAALAELGYGPMVRAEEITVEHFQTLYSQFSHSQK